MDNKISQDILAAAITNVNTAIATIRTNLPFLIALTPADRLSMPKMGDKTLAFVRKSYEYAKLNPGLVPPYLSVEELRKDVETAEKLHAIYGQINDLNIRLDDTMMLASSEAFIASLSFYGSVQGAAKNNIPGAKAIAEDLSNRFSYRKAKVEIETAKAN